MKKFLFRPFRHPSKDVEEQQTVTENAYLTRREQVRKAQRTHRERKQAYIKTLETEVLQLRTNEGNLLQEIGRLKRILTEHGIQLQSEVDSSIVYQAGDHYDNFSGNSVVSIVKSDSTGQQLQVREAGSDLASGSEGNFPSSNSIGSPSSHSRFNVFGNEDRGALYSSRDYPSSSPTLSPPADSAPSSSRRSPNSMTDNDLTNIGMEFVLTLESPCLPHTPSNPKDPSPTGHALTASAALLFHGPAAQTAQLQPSTVWETPTTGLERLLALSTNLDLEDELTPVQAWNYIRQHPAFDGIDLDLLRGLTGELLRHVKCHGFGGVIEHTVFETTVSEVLGISQRTL
ncbi:hypothetical protein V1517DRAFT_342150 [Lipomyces orientalis]|uniref:Uncharacterized protein n=1 Tax=Lipomyces orientalis TaxID=1233043 RepID=A0ACC3TFU5_9ASCO